MAFEKWRIPMPKGYQGTIWPLTEEEVKQVKEVLKKDWSKQQIQWIPWGGGP